jgi:hypothetical protein
MTVTNTVPPVISGTAQVGQTLTTTSGTWTHDLDYLTYAYQWLRCDAAGANCVDISGATNSSYVLTTSDVGSRIRSEVTATEQALPPPAGTWEDMLAAEFPITSFTPSRTVTVTSAVQLNAACADLQAGDRINASGFTYNGSFQGLRDKNLSDWAELHFTNVQFVATGTQYGFPLINTSKIRVFGADVSGGGYGVPIFKCQDVEFRGAVHDIGGTACHPVPNGVRATRITVVLEAWNCGLNHTLDPHADKGTGLHALYAGDSGSLPNIDCRYAVDTHDQTNCAGGVQLTNQQGGYIAVRAHDLSFRSTTQTAGNAIQHFGSSSQNCDMWIEAERITGHGFRSQGGSLSSNTVVYGRAEDFCLNPREGTKAWDTVGGITYGVDVQPDSFGPHLA